MMVQLRQFCATLSAFLLAVSLAACSPTLTGRTSIIGPEVPDAIRYCQNTPPLLTGDFTQRDVAIYIEKLRAAHRDCQNNLAAVDEILTEYEAELMAQAAEE